MSTDEVKVILERIDSVQKTVDIIDRDMAKDREDLQQFAIRLGAVESQIDELRKALINQADKIQDRVGEAVQPMINQTQDLKETIDKKKALPIQEKKKPWWKRW